MSTQPYTPQGRVTKDKLERMYSFSPSGRRRFMNEEHYEQLRALGYVKTAKYISAKVLIYIVEVLGPPND